jgi:hypothetical protein
MFTLAVTGFFIGLFGLWVLFKLFVHERPPEGLWFVFSVMGAIPVSATFALFGAVQTIQEEMRETRREIKHWQSLFQTDDYGDKPITQFKAGPPVRRIENDPSSVE